SVPCSTPLPAPAAAGKSTQISADTWYRCRRTAPIRRQAPRRARRFRGRSLRQPSARRRLPRNRALSRARFQRTSGRFLRAERLGGGDRDRLARTGYQRAARESRGLCPRWWWQRGDAQPKRILIVGESAAGGDPKVGRPEDERKAVRPAG